MMMFRCLDQGRPFAIAASTLPWVWKRPVFQSRGDSGCLLAWFHASSECFSTETTEYLYQHGIPGHVHDGILKALKAAYGREATLADLQQFGASSPDALTALADAVRREEERQKQFQSKQPILAQVRPSIQLHVEIPHHRTAFDLPWRFGESLLDVAKNHPDELGEYMEGTCGGQMSCCTCHVYLEASLFEAVNQLQPTTDEELDMLDLAYKPDESSSRLGCQVVLTDELLQALAARNMDDTKGDTLDSLVPHKLVTVTVSVPEEVNNVWK